MAGKMANILWFEGSFVETLKGWQARWFYITEPRDPEWTVDPEQFHSKARNTPFGGWQVAGRPLATIIGSQLMFSRL